MNSPASPTRFEPINRAYNTVFVPNRLSIGLVLPIERYDRGPVPDMTRHLERVQLAEALGFKAVWLRDVPLVVPSFGDAGQPFDPFVYLGFLAGQTESIALGVASIILPVRHPLHVAKAAASVDVLSGGRLLLGVASGDRPEEYPAMNLPYHERGVRFRQSFEYIEQIVAPRPRFENPFGRVGGGVDLLPKPTGGRIPLLLTGGSQQSPDWRARHGNGWMTYPRGVAQQAAVIAQWRAQTAAAGQPAQPAMQPLYVDLQADPDAPIQPIHLGFRSGVRRLIDYLKALEDVGVNHVALNLRFNSGDIEATLQRLADDLLPAFHSA
jgi:luciferase-type oxidoreductase